MKKVLIICAGLRFGGVERFSANICKYAPKEKFVFFYLLFDGLGDTYSAEILENGGKVISIPSPVNGYLQYIKNLRKLIAQCQFDIVHSHTQFNSGINVWVAKKLGVKIRISHSHTTMHEGEVSFIQKLYERIMRKMILTYSTHYCACGVDAGKWLYGERSFTVINNGINTESYKYSDENRKRIRQSYGLKDTDFVIGHSGTLSKLKNQEFLIRIMSEIIKCQPSAKLICLGTSNDTYRDYLFQVSKECGVQNNVLIPGAVINVDEHLSAFDVFVFPSLREGTPIALLEAQANGLPCIISKSVPQDAVVTDLVTRVSLDDKKAWIDSIVTAKRYSSNRYYEVMKLKGYDIQDTLNPLYKIYEGVEHD